jgi:hypothetical protein
MALRFKRTIDVSPHMFSTREHADTDWLLYCGSWQVGRVHEIMRPVEPRVVLVWSLTGPHTPEARVPMRGEALTVAEAKQQLVDAMRAWAIWAGLRTADGSDPPEPRWVQDGEDWHLLSGGFLARRVHRPGSGPRHDPHWMLLGTSNTECPGPRAGWAERIEAAKADLMRAWRAWREWAELV